MSDKNNKGDSLKDDDGYEFYTYDDGIMSYSEPADEIAFARLEKQGYTLVKDTDGNIIAAVAPRQGA